MRGLLLRLRMFGGTDMAKTELNPGALLSPLPAVLVSCGSAEEHNVFTVAWTGILCSHPPKTYVSIRPERHSHGMISRAREFVINIPPAVLARAVDLCGVKSGRDGDKFALAGLTAEESRRVSAPSVAECPISIECRVTDIVPLGSHDMFMADIAAVCVDEALMNKNGKLEIERCSPLAYAHGTYYRLGEALGTFGFSVRKKPPQGGGVRRSVRKNQRKR